MEPNTIRKFHVAMACIACSILLIGAAASTHNSAAFDISTNRDKIAAALDRLTLTDEESGFEMNLFGKTAGTNEQLNLVAEGIIFPDIFENSEGGMVEYDLMLAGDDWEVGQVSSKHAKKVTYADSFVGFIIETPEGDNILNGIAYTVSEDALDTFIQFIATVGDDGKLTDLVGYEENFVFGDGASDIFGEFCDPAEASEACLDQTNYVDNLEGWSYQGSQFSFVNDRTASTFAITLPPIEGNFLLSHSGAATLSRASGDFAAGTYDIFVEIEGPYEFADDKATVFIDEMEGIVDIVKDGEEFFYFGEITKFSVSVDEKTITYTMNLFDEEETKVGSISSATLKFATPINFAEGLPEMEDSAVGSNTLKLKIDRASFDTKKTSLGSIEES